MRGRQRADDDEGRADVAKPAHVHRSTLRDGRLLGRNERRDSANFHEHFLLALVIGWRSDKLRLLWRRTRGERAGGSMLGRGRWARRRRWILSPRFAPGCASRAFPRRTSSTTARLPS